MFICEPCLKKNYTNFGIPMSVGNCECCGKAAQCCDIPSKLLAKKEKPKKVNPATGAPEGKKSVRVTVEISQDFLKLLGANIRLGNVREKVEDQKADPCQMLGLMIWAEARGGTEMEIHGLLPPNRRAEIQILHDRREVLENGKVIKIG